MTSFLREAFGLVAYPFQKIHELYDLAGYYTWQALMNDQFLAISPAAFTSKPMQTAASAYDWLLPRARAATVETLTIRNAGSDYGPKPDIKPGLIKVGEFCMAQMGRVQWGNPVVAGAVLLTFAVAAYAMMHAGANGHSAAVDLVGTVYGASPNNPQPKND